MLWTQNQILVPVHRDYAVSMLINGSLKKLNLSIKLQPHPTVRSTYRDALLNGVEILKISDYNDNLAGPNPDPLQSLPPPSTPSSKSSKNRKKTKVISIIAGATSSFFVLFLIILLIFRRFIRAPIKEGGSWWGQKSAYLSKKNKSHVSSLPSDLCRCFSIDEIRAATNNFDTISNVGARGFGNVYKGHIDNGTVPVAIKRLKQGSQQGIREFQTEIEMLSQLRYNHLLSHWLLRKCHHEGVIYEAVDPFLIESISPESLNVFSDMALKCLEDDGNERPSFNDVVWGLEFVLQLQESTEKVGFDEPESAGKSEESALLKKATNVEGSSKLTSSSSGNQSVDSKAVRISQ